MMKTIRTPLFAAVFTLAVTATTQAADTAATVSPVTAAQPTAPKAYDAVGVVRQYNESTGMVVISHEAISGLSWPPMTMGFGVKDKRLLGKLVIGKKVQFQIAKDPSGVYVITDVK